jgi:hypothetical protein
MYATGNVNVNVTVTGNALMISLRAVLINRALRLTNALMKPRQKYAYALRCFRSFCCRMRDEEAFTFGRMPEPLGCALFAAYGGSLSEKAHLVRTIY